MKLPTEFNLHIKDAVSQDLTEGFCTKWKKQVTVQGQPKTIWIKASSFVWGGYEHDSLGEVIASQVANDLQIKEVTQYKLCILNITMENGQQRRTIGCYSFDFTQQNEEVVSLLDLLGYGCDRADYKDVIDETIDKTGLQRSEFRDYIDRTLLLDSIILNEDRRLGNLAVIKNKSTEKYRVCPIFDNGQCFGLAKTGWNLDGIYDDYHVTNLMCKPFASLHDEQLKYTKFYKTEEGHKELVDKQRLSLNKTMMFVSKLYEVFGYDFDEKWTMEKRIEVQRLRHQVGEVDEPILINERNFIIAQLRRRYEIVIDGQKSTYQPTY